METISFSKDQNIFVDNVGFSQAINLKRQFAKVSNGISTTFQEENSSWNPHSLASKSLFPIMGDKGLKVTTS